MDAYRDIESLPKKWLDDVNVEIVTKGNDHPPPPKGGTSVHIYAGTIYQVRLSVSFLTEIPTELHKP